MNQQEEQKKESGCFKSLMIAIILILAVTIGYQFLPKNQPKKYDPLEDVIQVNEPVLKVDNQGRYYISNQRSYYRIKSEKEKRDLLESIDKKTKEMEQQVKQYNLNIRITIEDERW